MNLLASSSRFAGFGFLFLFGLVTACIVVINSYILEWRWNLLEEDEAGRDMDKSVKAGITGFLVAIFINLFSPVYLDFVPSFLASIAVIYIFALDTFRDGLVAAFMTYIFNEGILGTVSLAILYSSNEPYPSFNVDIWTMFSPILTAVTALIAGYAGAWLARKKKLPRELRPLVSQQSPTA